MKKTLALLLCLCFLFPLFILPSFAAEKTEETKNPLSISARSCVLMEAKTGKILYAYNENEALPPASVTKVMTLLLVMRAIESGKISWEDTVTVSEHAASMGGSQIFLEVGETMSVTDMVKSVVIASANDAAVALAEHISGSEEAFVAEMNRTAAELGMVNTHFENTNGLDDTVENHTVSAKDIAIMSRELIRYPKILEYSSTWMDTVRGGAFTLTNTNRLVRFYPGATGLKTGSTARAGFCISATAERDGVSLIAVIMGAESRDVRNAEAKKLLDYGFASYSLYSDERKDIAPIALKGASEPSVPLYAETFLCALPKEKLSSVSYQIVLPAFLRAPVKEGDKVGTVEYYLDGECIGSADIRAANTVEAVTFFEIFSLLLRAFTLG